MSSLDAPVALPLLLVLLLICGWQLYMSWFRPEALKVYLGFWASFFGGWLPGARAYWVSAFNAWLLRFAFLFAFLIILGGVIFLLSSMF